MATPRDCMLLVISKGEQLIRNIQTEVNAFVEVPPIDIERERVILDKAHRALAALDSQDINEYRRLSAQKKNAVRSAN